MKTCGRCKVDLPLTDFTKKAATRDGLSLYCRPCCRAKHLEQKERDRDGYLAAKRRYRQTHVSEVRDYRAAKYAIDKASALPRRCACGAEILKPRLRRCSVCMELVEVQQREARRLKDLARRNSDLQKERDEQNSRTARLTDGYVKKRLVKGQPWISRSWITRDMVEAKREQLRLVRLIKENSK